VRCGHEPLVIAPAPPRRIPALRTEFPVARVPAVGLYRGGAGGGGLRTRGEPAASGRAGPGRPAGRAGADLARQLRGAHRPLRTSTRHDGGQNGGAGMTTYVALGDSITLGIGDPVRTRAQGRTWRGWAALLADGLVDPDLHILATSGACVADIERDQLPRALALRPDIASVVFGINDTLRPGFDPDVIESAAAHTVGALRAAGAQVLTMRLPDAGGCSACRPRSRGRWRGEHKRSTLCSTPSPCDSAPCTSTLPVLQRPTTGRCGPRTACTRTNAATGTSPGHFTACSSRPGIASGRPRPRNRLTRPQVGWQFLPGWPPRAVPGLFADRPTWFPTCW
jgi:lysophospholipase L1-like esterase